MTASDHGFPKLDWYESAALGAEYWHQEEVADPDCDEERDWDELTDDERAEKVNEHIRDGMGLV